MARNDVGFRGRANDRGRLDPQPAGRRRSRPALDLATRRGDERLDELLGDQTGCAQPHRGQDPEQRGKGTEGRTLFHGSRIRGSCVGRSSTPVGDVLPRLATVEVAEPGERGEQSGQSGEGNERLDLHVISPPSVRGVQSRVA